MGRREGLTIYVLSSCKPPTPEDRLPTYLDELLQTHTHTHTHTLTHTHLSVTVTRAVLTARLPDCPSVSLA
jgi:hypothetical protein